MEKSKPYKLNFQEPDKFLLPSVSIHTNTGRSYRTANKKGVDGMEEIYIVADAIASNFREAFSQRYEETRLQLFVPLYFFTFY